MGAACSTFRSERKCIQGFGGGTRGGKNYFEDLDINGKIILRWVFIRMSGCETD